ncbi:MAG TPA: DUF4442 domain-containing protein [Chitinophagales bacterium]|nr:DUF4442 domain-containing protein [Chitinophagales bacterium]
MSEIEITMNKKGQEEYKKMVLSPFFRAGLVKVMPMGAIADLKITELNEAQCKVTVPYKYVNKNPFNTTYWAVLGMAAEMASGAMVQMYTHKVKPSVSMFVTGCKGNFMKRAVGITTFICNDGLRIAEAVQETIATGEGRTVICSSQGFNNKGELLLEFDFEWSIKARKK